MIEMRRVKRYVPCGENTAKIVRVLQYRYFYQSSPVSVVNGQIVAMNGNQQGWSDWTDVKEVESE